MFIVKNTSGFYMRKRDFGSTDENYATVFKNILYAHEAVEEYLYSHRIDEMRVEIIDLDALTKSCYVVRHSFQWIPTEEREG